MTLLVLEGVTKRFAGLTAVEDVSFTVEPGSIMGLIGPNGAGKSTLLNLITGLSVPGAGHISIERDGKPRSLVGLKPHQIARLGIGRSFQHIRLFDDLSVLENVMVGMDGHLSSGYLKSLLNTAEVRREEATARLGAERLLSEVAPALLAMQTRRAADLAYADKRRLEIARALATRPGMLLLDEPAAGMAPQEIDRLADDLRKIRAAGTAILLIEHKMRLIERTTDSVVVLNHGRKLFEGTYDALIQDQSVVDAYLGRSYADSVATPG